MTWGIALDRYTTVFVVAAGGLVLVILWPYTDNNQKNIALGALVGLVGGHLNGGQSQNHKTD